MERKLIRFLTICAVIGLIFGGLPVMAVEETVAKSASGQCGEEAFWSVTGGVLRISGSGKLDHFEAGNAPWAELTGELTAIVVEEGITAIGANAFSGCGGVATVTLPGSLTDIGAGAFSGCALMGGIAFHEGLLTIGKGAFRGCVSLTAVTLPESVIRVEEGAFSGCTALGVVEVENPSCAILADEAGDTLGIPGTAVVKGYGGSTAETFAEQHAYGFSPFPYTCQYGYHRYTAVLTLPTCTEPGHTTFTCSDCGQTYQDSFTEPLGHTFEEKVTPPTTTEQGFTTHRCTVCGYTYQDTFVDPHVHTFELQIVAPTCTEGGYTIHTCNSCGFHYEDSQTEPLGHDWGQWQEAEEGWQRGCTRCGQLETGEGETYSFLTDEKQVWQGSGTLTFRLEGGLEKLETLIVDGQAQPVSYYEMDNAEGSLTLSDRCLEGLTPGDHVLQLEFQDGAAETVFSVVSAAPSTEPEEATVSGTPPATESPAHEPKPGSESPVVLWVVLILIILAAVGVGVWFALKKWKKI